MSDRPKVFVVDDDDALRDSIVFLISSVGVDVESYASARDFLDRADLRGASCIITDVRMPGMSGLDFLDQLGRTLPGLPVILITGHADVPMAVRALKAGAFDFIPKPFNDQELLDTLQRALTRGERIQDWREDVTAIVERMDSLTPREKEVLHRVVKGQPNKVVASELGVSLKTVESHRAKVMEKMEAESLAELVRMVLRAETPPPALG
jgi:FixJ family two-component response regulator